MDQLASARDRSSYVVKVDFTDENGDTVVPTAATWTLTDGNGEVVNERSQTTIGSLAATVYLALSGDDLEYQTDDDDDTQRLLNLRVVVVEATYTSSLTGGPLPVKKAIKFKIEDLPQVPVPV